MAIKAGKILVVLFVSAGCFKKNKDEQFQHVGSFEKMTIAASTNETKIPSEVWDRLEQFYFRSTQSLEQMARGDNNQQKKIEVPVSFVPLKVYLKEKNFGVLGGQSYQLSFNQGGGELDLANFIKQDKKAFQIAFQLGETVDDGSLQVFFVSNSRPAKIGSDTLGAGCNKYMDITHYYKTVLSREGVEANVGGKRHIYLLVGTYIFAVSKNSHLYLSQLTVRDSRHKSLHCRT